MNTGSIEILGGGVACLKQSRRISALLRNALLELAVGIQGRLEDNQRRLAAAGKTAQGEGGR